MWGGGGGVQHPTSFLLSLSRVYYSKNKCCRRLIFRFLMKVLYHVQVKSMFLSVFYIKWDIPLRLWSVCLDFSKVHLLAGLPSPPYSYNQHFAFIILKPSCEFRTPCHLDFWVFLAQGPNSTVGTRPNPSPGFLQIGTLAF